LQSLHCAHYAKTLCIHETVDQLTALDGAIFVENDHRHVFHVVIERVAERNHLDQWREKKEKESQRITPDDNEFLEQDGAESAKQLVFHHAAFCCSAACLAESSTNTSSREGPIS